MNIKRGLTSMIISTICFIYINYNYVLYIKVILYSYLILKKINERITDS